MLRASIHLYNAKRLMFQNMLLNKNKKAIVHVDAIMKRLMLNFDSILARMDR